jgi:hypothetical protein
MTLTSRERRRQPTPAHGNRGGGHGDRPDGRSGGGRGDDCRRAHSDGCGRRELRELAGLSAYGAGPFAAHDDPEVRLLATRDPEADPARSSGSRATRIRGCGGPRRGGRGCRRREYFGCSTIPSSRRRRPPTRFIPSSGCGRLSRRWRLATSRLDKTWGSLDAPVPCRDRSP